MDINNFNQRQSRLPQMNGTQQAGVNVRGDQLDPSAQQSQQAQQPEAPAIPSRRGFSKAELENLLRNADTDRDGSVSLEELQGYQQQLFSMQQQFAMSGNMDAIVRQLDILNLLLTPIDNPSFNLIAGLDGNTNGLSYGQAGSDVERVIGQDGVFGLEDIRALGGQTASPSSPRGGIPTGGFNRPIGGIHLPQPRGGRGGGGISGLDLGGLGVAPEV